MSLNGVLAPAVSIPARHVINASIRVLQKCGFTIQGYTSSFAGARGGTGDMVVPERREFDRASEKSEDGVASHAPQAKVSYSEIYDLRSTYAYTVKRGRRGGRVGDANGAVGRSEGIQEILADEAPNETGCAEEAAPTRGGQVLTGPTGGVLSRFCHGRSVFGSIWAAARFQALQEVV